MSGSFGLAHSLAQLQLSNSSGPSLAQAAGQVDNRHLPLLIGLHNVFTVLLDIGYLEPDQVHWPPHNGQPGFDAQAWTLIALGEEARKVIPLLPYAARDFEGDVLAPAAKSVSYMGEPDLHVRDPRFNENEEDLVPPHLLRLTEHIEEERDEVLLYDTLEGQVAWWNIGSPLKPAAQVVQDLEWQSASILSTWAEQIRDLSCLPVRSEAIGPHIETEPTLGPDGVDWTPPQRWVRNRVNTFRARQRIYRQHGWPDARYRRADALQAMEKSEYRLEDLEAPFQRSGRYLPHAQYQEAAALTQFLEEAVGPEAIVQPTLDERHKAAIEWERRMNRGGRDETWSGPL